MGTEHPFEDRGSSERQGVESTIHHHNIHREIRLSSAKSFKPPTPAPGWKEKLGPTFRTTVSPLVRHNLTRYLEERAGLWTKMLDFACRENSFPLWHGYIGMQEAGERGTTLCMRFSCAANNS